MIGPAPEYMVSKYWIRGEFGGHLSADAPDEFKRAFEEDMNGPGQFADLKEDYPEMKHPYMTWNGEVIDKG